MSVDSIVIHPGEGATLISPAGGPITSRLRSDQTGGSLTVMETLPPPGWGPPLHAHLREDEFVHVVEGHVLFRLEDDLHELRAGSFFFIPRGLAHTWRTGDAPARFLFGFTPGAPGMERFFERAAVLESANRGREAFRLYAADAGMEVLGPPLAEAAIQGLA